jgi:RNA polymerase sigma-70 factor, ECF subfamily
MLPSELEQLYEQATATFGPAMGRLARAYEANPEQRRDLLQEIHIALWRSLEVFDGRCSLRTWVYRVAHNTAVSHIRRSRVNATMVSLDEVEGLPDGNDRTLVADKGRALDRLFVLIQKLKPLDRQVIVLYLEEMDAASIGEITGLSAGNVATKVHRIKAVLTQRFQEGVRSAE